MLAIDDLELSPVNAAWCRFREEGLGRLERVVKARGEHYAHSSVGWFSTRHVPSLLGREAWA